MIFVATLAYVPSRRLLQWERRLSHANTTDSTVERRIAALAQRRILVSENSLLRYKTQSADAAATPGFPVIVRHGMKLLKDRSSCATYLCPKGLNPRIS